MAPKEQVVNNEVVAQPKADQSTEKAEVKELTPETNNDPKAAPAVKTKKEPFDKKKMGLSSSDGSNCYCWISLVFYTSNS